jgi:hypothetical protein
MSPPKQVASSAYSSTLKMEATYSSETLVDFQRTTQCHIPEDITLHNHFCENLKSYILILLWMLKKWQLCLSTGPESRIGDMEVNICAFKTSATGSNWSLHDLTTLPLRKDPLVPVGLETRCTTDPVWVQ